MPDFMRDTTQRHEHRQRAESNQPKIVRTIEDRRALKKRARSTMSIHAIHP